MNASAKKKTNGDVKKQKNASARRRKSASVKKQKRVNVRKKKSASVKRRKSTNALRLKNENIQMACSLSWMATLIRSANIPVQVQKLSSPKYIMTCL